MPDNVWPGRTLTDSGSTGAAASPLTTGAGPSGRAPQAVNSRAAAVTAVPANPFPRIFRIFPSARPPTRKKADIWYAKPESCQAMASASPRQPGDERHKSHKTEVFCRKAVILTANAHELLISVILTDWCNQDSARRKPFDKGCGDLRRRSGHDYTIVRHLFRPPLHPVPKTADNVAKPQLTESAFGIAQQLTMPLDRKYPAAETSENSRLIARTGADLEHVVPRARFELFGHQRHYIRLANGLTLADR